MNKIFSITGALLGALSVLIGAFAAHRLKATMSAENLQLIQTGVTYQMYHAIVLLVLGLNADKVGAAAKRIGALLIAGIILFSGSLFLISFLKQNQIAVGFWGINTPLGGLCFIGGWLLLAYSFFKGAKQ